MINLRALIFYTAKKALNVQVVNMFHFFFFADGTAAVAANPFARFFVAVQKCKPGNLRLCHYVSNE